MFTFFEFIIFFLILYITFTLWNLKTNNQRPPGPINFPLVGYLFQLGKKPYLTLTKLGKKYGDVVYLRIGSRDVVVLNGYETIIEALSGNNSVNFAGRPDFLIFYVASKVGSFSFMSYCAEWRSKRKTTTKAINAIVEPRSHSEAFAQNLLMICRQFADRVRQQVDQPYDPSDDIYTVAYQTIYAFCFGDHVFEQNEFFQVMKKNTDTFSSTTSFYNITNAYRCFTYLLSPIFLWFIRRPAASNKFLQFTENNIKKRMELKDNNEVICAADSLKANVHGLELDEKGQHKFIYETLMDILGAGVNTSTLFLQYIFLYLALQQEWQIKIQLQIDEVVMENEEVTMEHTNKLTLLNAFFLEIKRHSVFLPFGVYRSAIKDIMFHSYFIPKDTLIIPNIYSAHFDERVWSEPDKFDPNRFLTENGTIDTKTEAKVLLFGAGRRRCIGQHLADKNVTTIMAYLLKQFSFKPVLNECSLETHCNGTQIDPNKYKIIINKREDS